MSLARYTFLERLDVLRRSVSIDAVIDKAIVNHDEVARMLRNGLAVVGFSALEDFIKNRSGEILSSIGSTGVPFSSLPEKIRYAATIDAINAIKYQITFKDNVESLAYIQAHSKYISSTADTTYDLTPHAFAYDKPNVSEAEIKYILKCFSINDGWGQMSSISSSLGLTGLPLNESYKNASQRRHKAAHVANSNTPQVDLEQFVREAAGIAVSFDCLLSKSLQYISANDKNYLSGNAHPESSHINFRIIRSDGRVWKEYPPKATRAIKTGTDLNNLISQAARRAMLKGETLVLFDQHGNLNNWECY